MSNSTPITLKRDVDALRIPSGESMKLSAGTVVYITQSLGGTYTVMAEPGYLVRIDAKDADALGLEVPGSAGIPPAPGEPIAGGTPALPGTAAEVEKLVWEQLKTVFDPEIPVNVVELGLVYVCKLTPAAEGRHDVAIQMTLTAPGCGMGDVLRMDAAKKIHTVPGVREVNVDIVFEPVWNPGMMSEASRLQLGMF